MWFDWEEQLQSMTDEKRLYYTAIKQRAEAVVIPQNITSAIEIQPEDFDAFLLACVFKADQRDRLTSFSFELYDYYLKSFLRRFKNPVRVCYKTAILHCQDIITRKNGHFRLIEEANYCYGA